MGNRLGNGGNRLEQPVDLAVSGVRKSIGPHRCRVVALGAEPTPKGWCKRLARLDAGKVVDGVLPPALVQPSEEGRPEAVRVVQHGRHTREVVSANVEFAGLPDRLEGEPSCKLGLEELERKALKLGVGGAASDVLSPC